MPNLSAKSEVTDFPVGMFEPSFAEDWKRVLEVEPDSVSSGLFTYRLFPTSL